MLHFKILFANCACDFNVVFLYGCPAFYSACRCGENGRDGSLGKFTPPQLFSNFLCHVTDCVYVRTYIVTKDSVLAHVHAVRTEIYKKNPRELTMA